MGEVPSVFGPRRYLPRLGAMMVVPIVVFGLSACSSSSASPREPASQPAMSKGDPYTDLLLPKLQASVTDGAVGVAVDLPVTVSAGDGVLGPVSLTNEEGMQVAGTLSPDGLTWSTAEPLGYSKHYTLNAQALGLSGVINNQMSFQTSSPQNLTMPYVVPNDGAVVGIGQPVAVRFDENIADRLAAQRAITITANPPVEGGFYWLSNREVRWRPKEFWQPGTTIDVAVKSYGVDLGDGLFGQEDVVTRFTIGDAVVATADDATKTLTVRLNGAVVKTMPISMGKDRTPTENGTYLVGDRHSSLFLDSSTYGVPINSPDGYRIEADWATQLSYSGIYLHSAPWSVANQGYRNVSHGCINVNTSNAKWFYDNTKRGDIVEVVNTVGSTLPGIDGLGDWNIPWDQWLAGNAST